MPGAESAVVSILAVQGSNSREAVEIGTNQAGVHTAAPLRSQPPRLNLRCPLLGLPALMVWLLSRMSRRRR